MESRNRPYLDLVNDFKDKLDQQKLISDLLFSNTLISNDNFHRRVEVATAQIREQIRQLREAQEGLSASRLRGPVGF